jgi:molecular chaperone DnaJ
VIWTPKNLNKEERQILEKLSRSENFKPNQGSREKSIFSRMKDLFEQ